MEMGHGWLLLSFYFTFRKNKPPAGSRILCDPGSALIGSPSLNHVIVGVGIPSALQLSVAGSCRGTMTSRGCSVILGYSKAERRRKEIIVC